MQRKQGSEKGFALVLTMILLAVVSVMAVSMMFIAQTETWSTANYRNMTQSRDAAESGISTTAHFLSNDYVKPTVGGLDDFNGYDITVSPVTNGAVPVGFVGAGSNLPANLATMVYPNITAYQTAFDFVDTSDPHFVGNGRGFLPVSDDAASAARSSYTTFATLLAMRAVPQFGTGTPGVVQMWEITSRGGVAGVQAANVEISTIYDEPVGSTFNYAVFAGGNGCDELLMGGGGVVDSYSSDEFAASGGVLTLYQDDGNVGTNGSLTTQGSTTTIYGDLSTPNTGVGNCAGGALTAWDNNNGTLTGEIIQLASEVIYPLPDDPDPIQSPVVTHRLNSDNRCSPGMAPNCVLADVDIPPDGSDEYVLAPTCPPGGSGDPVTVCGAGTPYGDIDVGAGKTLVLTSGTYNINSITLAGGANVIIDPGPVMLNVQGDGIPDAQTVVDFTGGTVTNASLDSSDLQIVYNGTGQIKLSGGAETAALVYAPLADVNIMGSAPWYGAIIGGSVSNMGGAAVHYDLALENEFFTIYQPILQGFTWKKF